MRRAVVMVLTLSTLIGCDGKKKLLTPEEWRATHATTPEQSPGAPQSVQPDMAQVVPKVFATDLRGQMMRIYERYRNAPDGYTGDQQAFRKLTGWKSEKIEPGAAYNFFNDALGDAEDNGLITFPMLKKSAERYAGRPWYALNAKIEEISEKDGRTIARINVGSGGTIFFVSSFASDFVEKDRVDIAGYLAGTHSYTSQAGWNITLPALAGAVMFKPGSFSKMSAAVKRAQGQK